MIHEFRNPVPVKTDIGYGWLMYVRDGGTFANDVFAVVMEKDGGIRHFRSEQFTLLPNPTFDIQQAEDESAGTPETDVKEAQIPNRISGEGDAHADLALPEESDRGQHVARCTHK
jgi:hypothetical protein